MQRSARPAGTRSDPRSPGGPCVNPSSHAHAGSDSGEHRSIRLSLIKAAAAAGVGLYVSRVASLLTAFFTPDEVVDYTSAKKSDTKLFAKFFWQVVNDGIYWPPSQFEAAFISLAHSDEDIDFTIAAIARALKSLK